MKKIKKIFSLCAVTALALEAPLTAFASSPEFARTAEQWAKLQDNYLGYDEIEDLVDEYNTTVQNNQLRYYQNMQGVDFDDYAEMYRNTADDLYSLSGMADSDVESITYEMQARQAEINAVIDEEDHNTSLMSNELVEKQIVMQAQSLMISYYELQKELEVAQNNKDLLQRVLDSTRARVVAQMAVQADVLLADQNLQSADANILSLQNQIEETRQKLIVMTGWSSLDHPEIGPLPDVDFDHLAAMNPATDLDTAIANDYTLKIDQYKADHVSNEANKAIYKETASNDKQQIGVDLNSAYQSVTQAKASYDEAVMNLDVDARSMNTAATQYAQGTISLNEYRQTQTEYSISQIQVEIAKLNLFQAMETYDWVVKGVRA